MLNAPRKNHEHLAGKADETPQSFIRIIGLKGILLYWLNCFLSSKHEEKRKGFTDFSHNSNTFTYSRTQTGAYIGSSDYVDWAKVPLQRSPEENSVLYTSALPQTFPTENISSLAPSQKVKTQQIVNQLKQFQIQSSKPYLHSEDSVLQFLSMLWHEFEISSDRSGWIAFRLSKRGITKWLQHILKNDLVLETHHTLVIHQLLAGQPISAPDSASQNKAQNKLQGSSNTRGGALQADTLNQRLWQAQHTYARCCSFIHRETTANIQTNETTSPVGQWQSSASSQQLVQQLIDMGDAMFWIPYRYPSKQYLLLSKVASQLCQSFERFQRQDLPGFVPCSDSARLQSHRLPEITRFDLVIATRNMLGVLLHRGFRVIAPRTL